MAKDKLTDYDATASNNTDIGGIDINQGTMIPSNVDNAIREMMSHLKDFAAGTEAVSSIAVSGDLTVDTNTLKVDSTNNNVGIGTASPTGVPTTTLHINGTTNAGIHITDSASGATDSDGVYLSMDSPNLYIQNKEAGFTAFETSGTERMRIDSNGHLILKKNLVLESTSEGIDFSGSGSSAETLDDYEEGTWTPTYSGSTSSPTVSYTEQHGEYVKIGRQVIARLELKTSSVSGGSGVVTVGGLPFATVSNDGSRSGSLIVGYSQGFASNDMAPQTGYASGSTTSIILGHAHSSNASSSLSGTLVHSDLASSGNNFLMATLIYTAA